MSGKEDILIVCALEQETQDQLDDWDILYTGVGKVNATHWMTEYLCSEKMVGEIPKLVINYGTAGSRELPVGELVDCTKFIQRDMDCTGFGILKGQTPFEDTDYLYNGRSIIVLDSNSEFNPIGKHYTCGTGDNFVDNIEDEIEYVDVFDMEAYALAKVCNYYYVPFISFKYITDNANEHSTVDWEDNLGKGIIDFKEKILEKIK